MAKEVTYAELQELIGKGGVVVADFWAEWCGPCKMFAPTFEKVAQEYAGKAELVKCNVEQNPDAQSLGISSIPTIMVWKGGEQVDKLVGALSEDALKAKIDAQL